VNKSASIEYVYQYVQSYPFVKTMQLMIAGTDPPNISSNMFGHIAVVFPPLPEQKKIAEILSKWDAGIEKTEKFIEVKKELKKALYQQLLTGKKRFREFKGQEWKEVSMEEFGSFSKGAGVSKAEVLQEGFSAIRYGELYTSHHVEIKRIYSYISEESKSKSKVIRSGDILFAGSGETADEIGKCAVYLRKDKACAGGDIIIFSPKTNDSLFLAYLLNSAIIRRELRKLGQGQSVVHVYKKDLAVLKVSLPYLEEQHKIASVLNAADREIDLLNKKLENLKNQKKGLMQKLLTGKIRVKV